MRGVVAICVFFQMLYHVFMLPAKIEQLSHARMDHAIAEKDAKIPFLKLNMGLPNEFSRDFADLPI